jgi:hypothetical protein
MYPKLTTTTSHRHTEAPCKMASVKRRARSDAPYQSNTSIPIRAFHVQRLVPPPRLRASAVKICTVPALHSAPHSIRLTTRFKRINSPKKINDSMRTKNRLTQNKTSPPIGVKPGKGYSSLVKDILIEGGTLPPERGVCDRQQGCGHRIRVQPQLFTLLPLAFSTVAPRTARGFGGQ